MKNTISERITLIMNEYHLNKNSFSQKIGIKNNVTIGRIINENRNPSYEVTKLILQTFGSISADWLMTGQGEMLKSYGNSVGGNNKISGNNKININQGSTVSSTACECEKEVEYLKKENKLLKDNIKDKDQIIKDKEEIIGMLKSIKA